jgi:hypothetical protein
MNVRCHSKGPGIKVRGIIDEPGHAEALERQRQRIQSDLGIATAPPPSPDCGVGLCQKRRVLCRSDGRIYSSIGHAARAMGVHRSQILSALRTLRPTRMGFTFDWIGTER